MDTNIQALKNEQEKLRLQLLDYYSSGNKSLLELSKIMDIPYSSLRRFLWGGGFNAINIIKLKKLLEKPD